VKHLAEAFPDIPRCIELRSILLRGECDVTGLDESGPAVSVVVRDRYTGLVCVSGTPDRAAIREAVQRSAESNVEEIVAPRDSEEHILSALPSWRSERAVLHLLADSALLPKLRPIGRSGAVQRPFDPESTEDTPLPQDIGVVIRYLSTSEVHALPLDGEARQEYVTAALHTQVAATIVDGIPVSFCYAGATTETLWDMSLETLEAHKRQGYAALCAAFTIDQMDRKGKRPVWGALETNIPSLRLASKLGFRPVDEVLVFVPG
jgi:GNAT superfamily N-acetyltransferase